MVPSGSGTWRRWSEAVHRSRRMTPASDAGPRRRHASCGPDQRREGDADGDGGEHRQQAGDVIQVRVHLPMGQVDEERRAGEQAGHPVERPEAGQARGPRPAGRVQ